MVEPGTILLGKYRIERVLGRGGMGVVARAHHLQLDVPVAIKFLLPEVLERQDVVTRFLREAQAAVKLKSEHISRIIDVGTLESGAPYMVMEFLDGTDLSDLLRERGPLVPSFAVDLMLQACEALAEAHALGIVHRDIKPSNFFLTTGTDGTPLLKVLDFGISKAPVTIDEGITHTQALMGTPSYMSPEQMHSSKYVDARTDIWALGVVLYQLVSGRVPFRSESFAGLVMMVATQPMRPLDDVTLPAGLEDLIARCLAKDPTQRFQSMAELAAALGPYSGTPIHAARSIERTARVLGVATVPPVERARAHALHEPGRLRTGEGTGRPLSTIREGMGEQVPAEMSRPMHPGSQEGIAAVPGTLPGPIESVGASRRHRGAIAAAAAAAVLGIAVLVALLMSHGSTTGMTPAKGGTTPESIGSTGSRGTEPPVTAILDAGAASGIAVIGAKNNGAAPAVGGMAGDDRDGDEPASASKGDAGDNTIGDGSADTHTSDVTGAEPPKRTASRPERRQSRKTDTEKTKKTAAPREGSSEPKDPFDTRN